jgi:hypothetical protein
MLLAKWLDKGVTLSGDDWKSRNFPDADYIIAVKVKERPNPVITVYTKDLDFNKLDLTANGAVSRGAKPNEVLAVITPGTPDYFVSFCTATPRWYWIS